MIPPFLVLRSPEKMLCPQSSKQPGSRYHPGSWHRRPRTSSDGSFPPEKRWRRPGPLWGSDFREKIRMFFFGRNTSELQISWEKNHETSQVYKNQCGKTQKLKLSFEDVQRTPSAKMVCKEWQSSKPHVNCSSSFDVAESGYDL